MWSVATLKATRGEGNEGTTFITHETMSNGVVQDSNRTASVRAPRAPGRRDAVESAFTSPPRVRRGRVRKHGVGRRRRAADFPKIVQPPNRAFTRSSTDVAFVVSAYASVSIAAPTRAARSKLTVSAHAASRRRCSSKGVDSSRPSPPFVAAIAP